MKARRTTDRRAGGRAWSRAPAALGLLLALPALAVPAWAQAEEGRPAAEARVPNLLGATGLLLVPGAAGQRPGQVTAAAGDGGRFAAGGVVAGITQRLEIGLGGLAVERRHVPGDARLLLNAKANLLPETLVRPAVSIGVSDAFHRLDRGPGWYVVTSKELIRYFVRGLTGQNVALTLHLGYGGGLYHDEVMGGAELFLRRGFSAVAESAAGRVNVGGRYHARGVSLTVALLAWEQVGGEVSFTTTWR